MMANPVGALFRTTLWAQQGVELISNTTPSNVAASSKVYTPANFKKPQRQGHSGGGTKTQLHTAADWQDSPDHPFLHTNISAPWEEARALLPALQEGRAGGNGQGAKDNMQRK
ncbi:hypothetical protein cyc_03670 [Cyclospora cayetanensis]|uniref:Uncharacterized protein n=1 Tax=Cyclospora cayetanensis TaxID=88456 RepID=A0A1D3D9W9_9EIME|nr:hypothetical protein cyc_03670 [Cyclospora cayetanensis]